MNNDLLQTLKTPMAFSSYFVSTASLTPVKVGGGFLHSVTVGQSSMPTLTLYDMASGASGTVLAYFDAGVAPRTYVYDTSFVNGLSAFAVNVGVVPKLHIQYK